MLKKFIEIIITVAVCLYVLYSCSLGIPAVEDIYHHLTQHEVYHPKVNSWDHE